MYQIITIVDLVIGPIFLIIIFLIAKNIQLRHIESEPSFRFMISGLFIKIFGGIFVCIVYVYYYGGGDTVNYYQDCVTMVNLGLKSPELIVKYMFAQTPELSYSFDQFTGYPIYFFDTHANRVVKLTFLLCFVSFKSYIGQTILLATISYLPIWRLYQAFIQEYPRLEREMALAILFIPSVIFWGSGLLKDTITFASVCLFASSFSIMLTQKRDYFMNIIFLIVSSILMISIKPYIFFALLPGSVLWFGGIRLSYVKNNLIKSLTTPFLIIVSLVSGYLMLNTMNTFLGDYALDNVLEKAILTQQDLKNERYGGSSFDLGDFNATVTGVLAKAPAAINAALFRPYIWETTNLAMFMSGLENLIFLIFTIYLLIKLRVFNLFRLMFRHRILFFTVYFSLFFCFSVGLSTSNFGSLVRYKIPAIPFYLISLFIISATYEDLKKEDDERVVKPLG